MTKILLVEDDKSLREIYGVRLSAEGYEIVAAGDGEEALAIAVKERPDLIISDVMMPKISGFDMLDILRATPETKDLKVIMMTALSSDDQRQRGEALGANRYLVKSQVGIEDIVRTVHEVLGDIPGAQPTPAADFENVQAPIERTEGSVPLGAPLASTPAEIEAALTIETPTPEVTPQVAPEPATPAPIPAPEVPQEPIAPLAPQPTPEQPVIAQSAPAEPVIPTVSTLPPEPTQPTSTLPPAPAPVDTPISALSSNTIDQPAHELPSPTAPFSTPAPESLREQAMPQVAQPLDVPIPAPVPAPTQAPTQAPTPAPAPLEVTTPPQEPVAPQGPLPEPPVYAPDPQVAPPDTQTMSAEQPIAQPQQPTQQAYVSEQPTQPIETPAPAPAPAPFSPPQPLDRSDEPDFAQMLNDELSLNDPSQPPTPPASQ